jgi:peptidoglycan/xylan/chitin deacetylase (PgdA/CDA1 family)
VADRQIRFRHRGGLLVLALHNVVPNDAPTIGDRSLHIRLSVLVGVMERLLDLCEVRALGDERGHGKRPGLAVTFDDAYRGAVTIGLPALHRMGVPATVFVPTALVGDREFWWDCLADAVYGLDDKLRHHAIEHLRGDGEQIGEWAGRNGAVLNVMPELWRSAGVEELRAAVRMQGVELAPHSATHRTLDRLDPNEVRAELLEPLKWFEVHGLPYRRVLAYPYGRSSFAVRAAAAAAEYESAWKVSGGWYPMVVKDRFDLPRMNVPGGKATAAGVMLRAAGIVQS